MSRIRGNIKSPRSGWSIQFECDKRDLEGFKKEVLSQVPDSMLSVTITDTIDSTNSTYICRKWAYPHYRP